MNASEVRDCRFMRGRLLAELAKGEKTDYFA